MYILEGNVECPPALTCTHTSQRKYLSQKNKMQVRNANNMKGTVFWRDISLKGNTNNEKLPPLLLGIRMCNVLQLKIRIINSTLARFQIDLFSVLFPFLVLSFFSSLFCWLFSFPFFYKHSDEK